MHEVPHKRIPRRIAALRPDTRPKLSRASRLICQPVTRPQITENLIDSLKLLALSGEAVVAEHGEPTREGGFRQDCLGDLSKWKHRNLVDATGFVKRAQDLV